VLLADSSALPITLHDYVKEIRKEFDHFMAEYHEDFHKENLSYGNDILGRGFSFLIFLTFTIGDISFGFENYKTIFNSSE